MPESVQTLLETARKAAGMKQYQLAAQLNIAESTYRKWESGEIKEIDPDEIDKIECITGYQGLWNQFMQLRYDSYRRRFSEESHSRDLLSAIDLSKYEARDVAEIMERLSRSVVTGTPGKIDDPALREQAIKEIREMLSAGTAALAELEKE